MADTPGWVNRMVAAKPGRYRLSPKKCRACNKDTEDGLSVVGINFPWCGDEECKAKIDSIRGKAIK